MTNNEKNKAPTKPEETKGTATAVPKAPETKEVPKTPEMKKDPPKEQKAEPPKLENKAADKAAEKAKPSSEKAVASSAKESTPAKVEGKDAKSTAEAPKADKAKEEKKEPAKSAPVDKEKPDIKEEPEKADATPKDKATPEKPEEKATKAAPAVKAEADKAKEEKVAGPAAAGPAGVSITQVLTDKLAPPSDKDIEELPLPKDGEAFFAVLHPKYLVNSAYNCFSVDTNGENFKELLKSIEQNGIKEPVKARPRKDGKGIEIVSGQRRHIAATMLGYPVPTIIERIDDDDAKIQIADGNLHRDKISSYDLSRSLRMKMDAMKQKVGRRKKSDPGYVKMDTDEIIAKEMGISVPKLNRIIRLSEAERVICDRVDDGSLALSIAYSISFLKPENQEKVSDLMDINYKVSTERIERMKKAEKAGKLTDSYMRDILEDKDLIPKEVPKPVMPAAPAPDIKPAAPIVGTTAPPVPAPPAVPQSPSAPTPLNPLANAPASAPMVSTVIPKSPDVSPVIPSAQPNTASPVNVPPKKDDIFKGEQERPQSTKVVLTGDRLRKYFPDVEMTPREIEESIYEALEERRQRQERMKAKAEHKFTR